MPDSQLTRRARLRSRALMEPLATSVQALREVHPGPPVVPFPDVGQALLEGSVFRETETLYFRVGDDPRVPDTLPGALDVTGLHPRTDSLVVDVDPLGADRTIAAFLFPRHEDGEGSHVYAPGLRMRAWEAGVEVYRPGLRGAVRFRGVEYDDVVRFHRRDCPAGQCIAEVSPQEITVDERDRGVFPAPRSGMTLSAMVRRLGILRSWGATCIDTWRWPLSPRPDGVVVEAWFPSMDVSAREAILATLCSKHFSPHWSAEPLIEVSGKPSETYFVLHGDELHADIQLRLFGSW